MKKIIKIFIYILPILAIVGLLWTFFYYTPEKTGDKLTLIALIGTALIYSFQLISMNEQRDISERSFKNQEKILEEQKNIAQKQYNFDLFTLRMNLRNELHKAFTFSLSAHNYDIENNVNDALLAIGKLCDDIKFAFPANKKLDELIIKFKSCCTDITKLAHEKETIIECGGRHAYGEGWSIKYKDCIRVISDRRGDKEPQVINKEKLDSLKISKTKIDIIFGIIAKYIDYGETKDDIVNFLINQFQIKLDEGNNTLSQIFHILDKDINL